MSERPFMQLYVSDFIGDTLHLSTEQVGAYLLLLMAMWNAGGSLPNDEAKLARVTRMSVKKWRSVAADLMGFFTVDGDAVRHGRLTKELQKSESKSKSRASAGAKGYAAKALKDKDASQAIASGLLKHSPDTRNHIAASQQPRGEDLVDRLAAAAGMRGNLAPSLAFPGEIIGLMQAGFDLEADILPAIKAKPNPRARSWAYFVPQIRDAADRKNAAASIPAPERKQIDWADRLEAFKEGRWPHAWGPRPGEAGCGAPPELIARIAA